jgi:hypothetical protein
LEKVAVVEHSDLPRLLVHCAFCSTSVFFSVVTLNTARGPLIVETQLLLVFPWDYRNDSHLIQLNSF